MGASAGTTSFSGLALGGNDLFTAVCNGSSTIDPASIATASQATATIAVPGAVFGMAAMAFPPASLQGLQLTAYVSAVDTVTIVLKNDTGAAVDLPSGAWKVKVFAA